MRASLCIKGKGWKTNDKVYKYEHIYKINKGMAREKENMQNALWILLQITIIYSK
jgi:hypothetical protein